MKTLHWILPLGLLLSAASWMLYAAKTDGMNVLTGKQAFSTTPSLKPGRSPQDHRERSSQARRHPVWQHARWSRSGPSAECFSTGSRRIQSRNVRG
jgi:hypothetical protein